MSADSVGQSPEAAAQIADRLEAELQRRQPATRACGAIAVVGAIAAIARGALVHSSLFYLLIPTLAPWSARRARERELRRLLLENLRVAKS